MIKIAPPLTNVDSEAKLTLGTRYSDKLGNEYIYLKGVASGSAYALVSYGSLYGTTLVNATTASSLIGPMAALMAAVDSTSEYGWGQIKGTGTTLSVGSVTADSRLQPTTTSGYLDDATGGG
jgi:hypothetical protein